MKKTNTREIINELRELLERDKSEPIEESYLLKNITEVYEKLPICLTCNGSGKCSYCKGTGRKGTI